MKTTITTIAASLLMAGAALATPLCEPPGTFYTSGDGTLYDHGCHAFATHDLSPRQAAQLWESGHCSMYNPLSGGVEVVDVEVETETEVPDGYSVSWVGFHNGNFGWKNGWQVSQNYRTVTTVSTERVSVEIPENGRTQYDAGIPLCDEAQVNLQ
jgi:hypothetical protein